MILFLAAVLAVPLCLAFLRWNDSAARVGHAYAAAPAYTGSERCAACHAREYELWRGSDHDLAMDRATASTVLGDFDDARFDDGQTEIRFYKKEGRFYVNAPGPGGERGDFEVTHVFGARPLQQYLVPFSGGRLQALSVAWDVKRGRWYALPSHTADPGDWLYWTNGGANWNGMCADCHSTNLAKNYHAESDSFSTTWSEIDVGCEACHGPASTHVRWAEKPPGARPRLDNAGLAVKTGGLAAREQLALCARCHARRTPIADYRPDAGDPMDHMIPELLRENLYYADGQIEDEVYVYGSFTQSRMYRKGVKCGDCHDLHSLGRRAEGNTLCLRCHAAAEYDAPAHHFHRSEVDGRPSAGDDCVRCHMTESVYMGIDWRADHAIRIPRPDLTVALGTPNACNAGGCHDDRSAAWAAERCEEWYGPERPPHFAPIIAAGRAGRPEARRGLIALAADTLAPVVARATSLSLLARYPGRPTEEALLRALGDGEALVRQTALAVLGGPGGAAGAADGAVAEAMAPLLRDPVRAVRAEAAFAVASAAPGRGAGERGEAFAEASAEYMESMEYSADFPFGRYNLGNLQANLGEYDSAAASYRAALALDGRFQPARYNLALLLNRTGRNEEAEALLRELLQSDPARCEAAYALGLLLVEMERPGEALPFFDQAAAGMPFYARVHYNRGLLLETLGRRGEAERSLKQALALEPDGWDSNLALADLYIRSDSLARAEEIGERLVSLYPARRAGHDILALVSGGSHTGE